MNIGLRRDISASDVAGMLARGEDVAILDVREVGEYSSGHIAGAVNIPQGLLPLKMSEIPRAGLVILVCRRGSRSAMSTEYLLEQGVENVANMLGGMQAYDSIDDVESGSGGIFDVSSRQSTGSLDIDTTRRPATGKFNI